MAGDLFCFARSAVGILHRWNSVLSPAAGDLSHWTIELVPRLVITRLPEWRSQYPQLQIRIVEDDFPALTRWRQHYAVVWSNSTRRRPGNVQFSQAVPPPAGRSLIDGKRKAFMGLSLAVLPCR